MIILCQTDHYYLFFSYITLVFYNIRRISYRMDMVTYVRMLSWHLTYWMGYGNYTCLHYHIIFDDHYYFPDVHPYFISVVTATFLLTSYLPISNTTVTRFLSPLTISAYEFYPSISFFWIYFGLELIRISNTLLGRLQSHM